MQQTEKPKGFYVYWTGVAVIAILCWSGMPIWLGGLLAIVWLIALVCIELALEGKI